MGLSDGGKWDNHLFALIQQKILINTNFNT